MKKFLIVIFSLSYFTTSKAQWTTFGTYIYNTTTSNSVGIGTSTPQPFKLSIYGNTVTDAKFGINGVQVLYLPDQSGSSHLGSLSIGNGMQNIQSATQAKYNTAIGLNSMNATLNGANNNTAVGYGSLSSLVSGTYNTAIGLRSMYYTNSGKWNVSVGGHTLTNNTAGVENTIVGFGAGQDIDGDGTSSGLRNTLIGVYAGWNTTTGTSLTSGIQNTFIGSRTGWGITTGSYNTIIGAMVQGLTSGLANTVIIADGQGNQRIYINNSGNMGIGTTSPGSRLDVKGTIRLSGSTSGYVGFAPSDAAGNTTYTLPTADGASGQQLTTNGQGILSWTSASGNTWTATGNHIQNSNYANGGVIIGNITNTSPFTNGGYKLLVAGGILTEKIKAALQSGANWSDHVFDENYKLKSLEDIESYISVNKHLPGIPAAQELVDNGGIDMNEMFAKQMEKIEELTLYLIEMKKEIKELQEENKSLKSTLSLLQNKEL
jgi:trimeric autotransporter adhesin